MTRHTRSDSVQTTIEAASSALERGYQPLPIISESKRPFGSAWTRLRFEPDTVAEEFTRYAEEEGAPGIGLLLGEPSNGLVDIDLDHPKAVRLKDYFLPRTEMRTGRIGRPNTHYWYRVEDHLPGTRRYKMPDGSVSVELRSTGAQTVIPPSIHPSGETYRWEGTPWASPTLMDGRVLAVQVALLGLGCILLENWPRKGGRHDAYLSLAGGLLRYGDEAVHPYWERNIVPVIHAIASATNDEDGPESREAEAVRTTIDRLRAGGKAVGFPRLAEILGAEHVEQVRRMVSEVESLSGWKGTPDEPEQLAIPEITEEYPDKTDPEKDPLSARQATWQVVNLDPYLAGQVVVPEPTILRRTDGRGIFYPGRVNSLYGKSESAKSWIAMLACMQEMALGERVLYLDFEDEPANTLGRLNWLGAGHDDIRHQFLYVRPEEPNSRMQYNRWNKHEANDLGRLNDSLLRETLDTKDPSLIIADGMTAMYGLHGLDSNDGTQTDIIINFLKWLTRYGRSTVILIDHIAKGGARGASPIGSQHKIAMVQGTAIQVFPIDQPMPGRVGHVELLIGKDRIGRVRQHSTDDTVQVAADVYLDSRVEGVTVARIEPPTPGTVVVGSSDTAPKKMSDNARLMDEVVEAFAGDLDARFLLSEIHVRIKSNGCTKKALRSALSTLKSKGVLIGDGPPTSHLYRLLDPS